MRGEECPYGAEKCRFSHDLKAYLTTRPPDIQVKGFLETCPTFERLGRCQFGCMCRFGDCHINKATGANLEGTPPTGGVPAVPQVKNAITVDLRTQLRKNTFPFVCQRSKHQQQRGAKKQEQSNNVRVETAESSLAAPASAAASAGNAAAAAETETSSSTNGVASAAAPAVDFSPLPTRTRKIIDFSNKVYVAPLSKYYCSCCEC